MAVLSSDGAMAGYVVDCTERYAVAMSVLNTSFRASGKLAGSDYFGSIYWDGATSIRWCWTSCPSMPTRNPGRRS